MQKICFDNSRKENFMREWELCINDDITVRDAMKKINETQGKVLFLINKQNQLIAALSDGDIRRFLLSGGKLEERALKAANKSPRFARNLDEAKVLFHKKNYLAVPIIDSLDVIQDIYLGNEKEQKKIILEVPVVINAGGKGTRLDPFTRVLPKPLIPVGDLPIIEHIMKQYQQFGCEKFHVITNYKRQLLKAYFVENEDQYDLVWYDEKKPLGTGGGLSLLKGKIQQTFFFTNCDILLQSNYESMLRFHKEHKNSITMICAYKNLTIPYGVIEMGKDGCIVNIQEKPELSFLTNTGMYIVEPEILEDISEDEAIGFPDIVERQRQKKRNVAVYPVSEHEWMDMGQMPELEKMRIRLYGD